MTKQQVKQGVLEGYIHSADWYTVCTSHKLIIGDIFIQTDKKSTKIFALADGQPTLATNIAKLEHRVHEPARTVNMVPALANQYVLSGSKFAEAGYVSACDGDEVNIYDGRTKEITESEDAVLKGWQCPRIKLWWILLLSQVTDLNMHTLLLNAPTGRDSLNSLYTFPTTASLLAHIKAFNSNHAAG